MSDSDAVRIPEPPPWPVNITDPATWQRFVAQRRDWEQRYLWGELGALPQATLARQEAATAAAKADAAADAADVAVANSNATPSGGGAGTLEASVSPTRAVTAAPLPYGLNSTATTTLSVSGGTPNYTVTVTRVSGFTYDTVTTPITMTADGDTAITFTDTAAQANQTAVYRVSVTDSAGTPDTITIDVTVVTTVTNAILSF